MQEIFTTLFIVLLVFLIFGVSCHEVAKKNGIEYTGSWFLVGFFLGPLGLAFVLLAVNQKKYGLQQENETDDTTE